MMRVTVSTDGTSRGSAVVVERDADGGAVEHIISDGVSHASASIRTFPNGARCISAVVWVGPSPAEASSKIDSPRAT